MVGLATIPQAYHLHRALLHRGLFPPPQHLHLLPHESVQAVREGQTHGPDVVGEGNRGVEGNERYVVVPPGGVVVRMHPREDPRVLGGPRQVSQAHVCRGGGVQAVSGDDDVQVANEGASTDNLESVLVQHAHTYRPRRGRTPLAGRPTLILRGQYGRHWGLRDGRLGTLGHWGDIFTPWNNGTSVWTQEDPHG